MMRIPACINTYEVNNYEIYRKELKKLSKYLSIVTFHNNFSHSKSNLGAFSEIN